MAKTWPILKMLRQLMLTTFVASLAHALAALPRHAMPVSKWKRNSSNRVVTGDIRSFINCAASGDTSPLLCDVAAQIGRTMPDKMKHKELFEGFSVARLVHRHTWPTAQHLDIVDLCAGCGLVGLFLALMHSQRKVLAMDRCQSRLAAQLHKQVASRFHKVQERIHWKTADLRPVGPADPVALPTESVVVACHACGLLSDEAIAAASFQTLRPMILLPCCYPFKPKVNARQNAPSFSWDRFPWLERGAVNKAGREAVDAARISFLERIGYTVSIDFIDQQITPHNKAIVAIPDATMHL